MINYNTYYQNTSCVLMSLISESYIESALKRANFFLSSFSIYYDNDQLSLQIQ